MLLAAFKADAAGDCLLREIPEGYDGSP
jgi:hypothetical protein